MTPSQTTKPTSILLAATTGGHLTEGLKLFAGLPGTQLTVLSENSTRTQSMDNAHSYPKFLTGSIGGLIGGFFKGLHVIIKQRPDWVVSTGAEVGIGALIAAKLLGARTLFVETACRVRSKSKSAKVLYPLVDVFLVQHEEGLALFGGKTRHIGGLF